MPHIGIFWIFRRKLLGRRAPLSEGEASCPGLLDSPLTHIEVWRDDPSLRAEFPELRDREYDSVPRGRVLWDERAQQAIVYMDASLFSDGNKAQIIAFFDLTDCAIRWRTDLHYTTRVADLDALFDNDL